MGHRKWVKARSWREFHADDMIAEHNALYDAWHTARCRATETLDENNRLDRELDEARKRIAELKDRPVLTWDECKKEWMRLRGCIKYGVPVQDVRFREWLKSRLPAPTDITRVPFSDEQIERMARAAFVQMHPSSKWEFMDRGFYADAIRAALAAGGLEPCAVPWYGPDDVALRPSDDAWRTPLEMKDCDGDTLVIDSQDKNSAILRVREFFDITPTDAALMSAWLSSYAAAHGAGAPTGHVLRDKLVDAERKIENQRVELKRLNALVADLRDEVDEDNTAAESEWVRIYKQDRDDALAELAERASVPVKVRWDVTAEEAARMMQNIKCGLASNAEKIYSNWDDLGENYKEDFAKTFELLLPRLATHAVIDAPAGVPSVAPTDDQVEALALVMREACADHCKYDAVGLDLPVFIAEARAAIAHLSTRPDGLPSSEELAKQAHAIMLETYPRDYFIPYEDCDSKIKLSRLRFTDAILSALRSWLRDPVGWELVLDYGAIATIIHSAKNMAISDEWVSTASIRILDLCRSRIRPVYECKECAARAEAMMRPQPVIRCAMCAEWEKDCRALSAASRSIDARIAARAALEGE